MDGFSREWPDAGEEPLYILETAEADLVRLYAITLPSVLPEPS